MARVWIASPEQSDLAQAFSASEQPAFPAKNLLRPRPDETWRSTDAGTANTLVEFDLGQARTVRLAALLYVNATASARWRVRAATTQADLTVSPTFDSSLPLIVPLGFQHADSWTRKHALLKVDPAHSARWWRVDIQDTSNPDGFLEASRIYLSDPWEPSRNMQFGWQQRTVDSADRARALSGTLYAAERGRYREVSFSLLLESEAEMFDEGARLDRVRGRAKDLLIIRDIDSGVRRMDWTLYGTMSELMPVVNSAYNVYTKRFLFEEWEHP